MWSKRACCDAVPCETQRGRRAELSRAVGSLYSAAAWRVTLTRCDIALLQGTPHWSCCLHQVMAPKPYAAHKKVRYKVAHTRLPSVGFRN